MPASSRDRLCAWRRPEPRLNWPYFNHQSVGAD
jgi:hypothetical protein